MSRLRRILEHRWPRFWMRLAGQGRLGRLATRLAGWFVPPYKGRYQLAALSPRGYIAPSAALHHSDLHLGAYSFIGERVTIYQHKGGGPVSLGDRAHLNSDCIIEVGPGGSVLIGPETFIQPRCQLTANLAPIEIGRGVQIAPGCCFYSYDHGVAADRPISAQPLTTKGGIIIEDDAWLGAGVIVLDGVRIGQGAIIGAGAVVNRDVPDGAMAVGVPARVVKRRSDLT
jgi:acetyltransferase-like isoleucine patch superfamily enzyme